MPIQAYWNDPDEGLCSGPCEILARNGDVWIITLYGESPAQDHTFAVAAWEVDHGSPHGAFTRN